MIKPIMIYTQAGGCKTWDIGISFPKKLPPSLTKFPKDSVFPFFELWKRLSEMPKELLFFGVIDIYERFPIFFYDMGDVLHFLKEYIPMFKSILELQKLSDEK